MTRLEEIILEHTRLAREFAELPANGGSTLEEADAISKRKAEIKQRVKELTKERNIIISDGRF